LISPIFRLAQVQRSVASLSLPLPLAKTFEALEALHSSIFHWPALPIESFAFAKQPLALALTLTTLETLAKISFLSALPFTHTLFGLAEDCLATIDLDLPFCFCLRGVSGIGEATQKKS
jgi:hypothetical protein